MPDVIKLLPDVVANQIAAGEVIQRPASAVKELLENSVDAGATEIKLIVKDAGKTLIQVNDNGCGMSETDLRMSFERHATSKIQTAQDLFSIRTKGFRGEALASIAAIAQVEIKSKRINDELGSQLRIEGSKVIDQNPCSCNNGTAFMAKNLFYNVPARRNFLKSNTAEMRHIIEEFQRVALVHPDIAFSLFHNNKPVYQLTAANLKQRIVAVFGAQYNPRLVPVEQATDIVNIKGFIGKPEFARKTRGEQYFFANGRFIKHPYLNHAVENAFEELLPEKAYPSYFLYLDVNTETIDVNIHPTKTEVNFQNGKIIYAMLKSAIRQALGKYSLTPTLDFDKEASFDILPPADPSKIKAPQIQVNPDYNPFESGSGSTYQRPSLTEREINNHQNWRQLMPDESVQSTGPINDVPHSATSAAGTPHTEIRPSQMQLEDTGEDNKPLLQLHNRYIVTSLRSGCMILDQQLARERILFERYMALQESPNRSVQQLLFPHTLHVNPAEAELLRELLPQMTSMGFEINEFGKNTFIINGTPAEFPEDHIEEMLESIIENFRQEQLNLHGDRQLILARGMARNGASRFRKKLQAREMQVLIDELFACAVPETAPSGKKIINILTMEEIIERFN